MSNVKSSVAERLNILVAKYENGTKAGFARAAGITPQGAGDLLSGKKGGPSFTVLQNILMSYPSVRPEWILFGSEPMEKSGDTNEADTISSVTGANRLPYGSTVRVLSVQVDKSNNENIGLVDTRVAAGYVAGGFMEREFIRKLPSFSLPDAAYRNGTFRAFQVSGDSMQSTLFDRDWVICRYVEHWDRDIRDNFVHVVVTQDGLLVKRLQNRLTDRGELALHSDNLAFPVQFVDGAAVREVWVAVAKLSRQFTNPRYDITTEVMRTRADVDELLAFMDRVKDHLGDDKLSGSISPIG